MGLFSHDRDHMVDISYMDPLQYGADDARTNAVGLVHTTYVEMEEHRVHPWEAPDAQRLGLALAGVAFAQDRVAELILDEAGVAGTTKNVRVPADVEFFAGELSATCHDRLRTAKSVLDDDTEVVFGQATIDGLQAENMMPYWPAYPHRSGYGREDWQIENSDPAVSAALLRGVVRAGRELEAEAYLGIRKIAETFGTPAFYSELDSVLTDHFVTPGGQNLTDAETYTDSFDTLDARRKAEVYRAAHDGFIAMMSAYVAVLAPHTLGESWGPESTD